MLSKIQTLYSIAVLMSPLKILSSNKLMHVLKYKTISLDSTEKVTRWFSESTASLDTLA